MSLQLSQSTTAGSLPSDPSCASLPLAHWPGSSSALFPLLPGGRGWRHAPHNSALDHQTQEAQR